MAVRLTREKLAQAKALVAESEASVWLTFVRETSQMADPALGLILEGGLTWHSALLVSGTECVAVVGNYDADPLVASGDWDKVVPYVQGIAGPLRDELDRLVPPGGQIAVNVSVDDVACDGLTHGMHTALDTILAGTRHEGALVSSEPVLLRLRGQKTPEELRRIQGAIAAGDRLFADIAGLLTRGISERAVYDQVHAWMGERGLGFAWDPTGDPIVNSGPDSMIGHGVPSETVTVQPGHVFHVDLGVTLDGYSSDVQRCWYIGDEVPSDVQAGLDAVNAAISAGAAVLRPGALGHEVDAAARAALIARGFPEYLHALGHQVGRTAHDGGAILGPLWERYGRTPSIPVREGEVYTLELGVTPPGRGYIGIEEMVVVTADGCRFLTERQLIMPCLDL
jgi:Xaa-Pro aminopeptidase